MALPTRGQTGWDDELNGEISRLDADVQGAVSDASSARSTATSARLSADAAKLAAENAEAAAESAADFAGNAAAAAQSAASATGDAVTAAADRAEAAADRAVAPTDEKIASVVGDENSAARGALNNAYGYFVNLSEFDAADDATDNSPMLQAAIDSLPPMGGTVYIPPGTYRLATPVTPRTGLRLLGSGRATSRLDAALGVFEFSTDLEYVSLEHLNIRAHGGHIFDAGATGGMYLSRIASCVLDQWSTSHSVWHQDGSGQFIDNTVDDCDLYRPAGSTVPGWYIRQTNGSLNGNHWTNTRVNSRNSTAAPFFHLDSAAPGSFAAGNRFIRITGEQSVGGLIHAYSVNGLAIEDVVDWDATVGYAADLIKVGKSAGSGALSRGIHIRNVGRQGGTLASPHYDINCPPGECVLVFMENPNPASGSPRLNYPAISTFIFGAAGIETFRLRGQQKIDSPEIGVALDVGSSSAAGAGLLQLQPTVSGYAGRAFQVRDFGDTQNRFDIGRTGSFRWGNGSGTPDVTLQRAGVGILNTSGKFTATGGIGVGNSAAATTPGAVVRKMQVFDANGNSLGYVPIYDNIT